MNVANPYLLHNPVNYLNNNQKKKPKKQEQKTKKKKKSSTKKKISQLGTILLTVSTSPLGNDYNTISDMNGHYLNKAFNVTVNKSDVSMPIPNRSASCAER